MRFTHWWKITVQIPVNEIKLIGASSCYPKPWSSWSDLGLLKQGAYDFLSHIKAQYSKWDFNSQTILSIHGLVSRENTLLQALLTLIMKNFLMACCFAQDLNSDCIWKSQVRTPTPTWENPELSYYHLQHVSLPIAPSGTLGCFYHLTFQQPKNKQNNPFKQPKCLISSFI